MMPPDLRGTIHPAAAPPGLRVLPLAEIQFRVQNPRTDAAVDLDKLVASIAAVQEPDLVQLPLVQEEEPGTFQLIALHQANRSYLHAKPTLSRIPITKIEWRLPAILMPCLMRVHILINSSGGALLAPWSYSSFAVR